jgi:hypothetical protein
MNDLIQCPNCSGPEIITKTSREGVHSGKKQGKFGYLVGVVVMLASGGIVAILSPVYSHKLEWNIVGMGLGLILTTLFSLWLLIKGEKAVTRYYHQCRYCDYTWNRLETDPLPPVTVRLDLIQKGKEKLRKQQEALRKQTEDASAAAYLHQQNQHHK